MDPAWFERIRAQHREILEAADRLAQAVAGRAPLAPALDAFLAFERTRVRPLLAEEEQLLGPLLDRFLPPEIACSATFRSEHETLCTLLDELRRCRGGLAARADAESEVETLVSDLVLLLRDHMRREDSVLGPLLRQLDEARDA
jgi:iron-sulfur cluster repair protein YtfE (RIC family)